MTWCPVLDDIEASAYEADLCARSAWSRMRDNREPSTRETALGGRDCWCGAPQGHDWPGKATGAAHPRG